MPFKIMDDKPAKFENWKGILWALVAALSASAMSFSVRGASLGLDTHLVSFYRALFGMGVILLWLLLSPKMRQKLRFSEVRLHIIRGAFIGIATLLGFYALATIELTAASVLFGLAPIFTTLFSVLFLKQRIGISRSIAILFGFIGALIIIDPRFSISIGMLSALCSALLLGAALAMSRGLAQRDGALSLLVSSLAMTLLVSAVASWAIFEWPRGISVWFWLTLLVIAGLIRLFADIESYLFAEAAILTPFFYLRLVFIPIGAYFLFDELSTLNTWIGAIIVVSVTLYISYREQGLAKKAR